MVADAVTRSGREVPVDGPDDPRVAPYAQLTDRQARRRIETEHGVFVVEGLLALDQLVASAYPVVSVLVSEAKVARVRSCLDGVEAPVYVAAPEVLAGVAGFDVHRGVLALGGRLPGLPAARVLGAARRAGAGAVVVTEGINDHENLGAVFRNAAAFGAGAVLSDPTTADPLYRRAVRVSLGHVLALPFARLRPWPAALGELGAEGWVLMALTPSADAVPIDTVARAREGADAPPLAILVGAEGRGLTPAALDAADLRVRIPLARGVDSLNVATAAAIALHRLVGAREGDRRPT